MTNYKINKNYESVLEEALDLKIDKIYSVLKQMTDDDISNFYFDIGQYHATKDELIKKRLLKLLHRYQRKDKIKYNKK